MSDLIKRADAIEIISKMFNFSGDKNIAKVWQQIKDLPSVEPEVKNILYSDCANAMLMMWMDDVLTDDEYNRIIDKLNEYEKKNGNVVRG